jgi:sRNA-binding carbon storage regulator CsrA
MLVLTRRPGESILLTLPDGREIIVKVLEHQDGADLPSKRIGIDAPDDVQISRPD